VATESDAKYSHDPNLQRAVDDVRKAADFAEISDFKIVAVFAKGKAPADREVASCRKVPNAIRAVSGLDFLLVFWRTPWDEETTFERHRTIVHELMHVDITDDGEPKVRRHQGDFCEIPQHDKESYALAKKISISPYLQRFDRQAAITEPRMTGEKGNVP
jgi:predicted metallopeptidase